MQETNHKHIRLIIAALILVAGIMLAWLTGAWLIVVAAVLAAGLVCVSRKACGKGKSTEGDIK